MEAPILNRETARGRPRAGAVLALAVAAALLLVAAELSTIASVDVPGGSCEATYDQVPDPRDRCALGGLERHGGALLLLAALAGVAAWMSVRGSAGVAGGVLLLVGAATLGIALIGDLPVTDDAGAIGDDFDGATAQAGLGFYLELTAGILALVAGTLSVLTARTR